MFQISQKRNTTQVLPLSQIWTIIQETGYEAMGVSKQWRGHFKSYVQSLLFSSTTWVLPTTELSLFSTLLLTWNKAYKSGTGLQDNWLTFCEGTLQLPQLQGDVLNTPSGKHFHSPHWKELLHFHWKYKVTSELQIHLGNLSSNFCKVIIKAENTDFSFLLLSIPRNCKCIYYIKLRKSRYKKNSNIFPCEVSMDNDSQYLRICKASKPFKCARAPPPLL